MPEPPSASQAAAEAQKQEVQKQTGGPQIGPYIFGKTLGTGATGKVKIAKHVETGELVAIKIIRKDFLARKPTLRKKLQREITVMKLCDHPNVLKLIDVFEIETHLFLVIEYVDGCELFDYLVKKGVLSNEEALGFFHQIICGLEYCHRRLICHRDLKPENILLDRKLNVKIADFGMTSLNPPGSLLETSCGSPHYAAPEVVSGEMYNGLEADIWSTGVILYAMLTGRLPFDDDNIQRLLNKVRRGVVHIPASMRPDCKDLLRSMLTVDPKQRITISGIKEHVWYKLYSGTDAPDDHFVLPDFPIPNPNREVVQGLVDLGWGDADAIIVELTKTDENLEKVFYLQLARHHMNKKALEEGADPANPADAASSADAPADGPGSWLPPELREAFEKHKANAEREKAAAEAAKANAPPSDNKDVLAAMQAAMSSGNLQSMDKKPSPPPGAAGNGAAAAAATAAVVVVAAPAADAAAAGATTVLNAKGEEVMASPQSHHVRSQSIIRETDYCPPPKENAMDDPKSSGAKPNIKEASWFDSFKTFFNPQNNPRGDSAGGEPGVGQPAGSGPGK